MPNRSKSAPFSTHARGVPLFDKNRFVDLPRHLARVILDFRDLSSSIFWFISCQTWYTLHCTLVTIFSSEGEGTLSMEERKGVHWGLMSGPQAAISWQVAIVQEVCTSHSEFLLPSPIPNPSIAAAFFAFFQPSTPLFAYLDWTLICFVIVLPLVGFTFFAYARKERCLDELSKGALCWGEGLSGFETDLLQRWSPEHRT